VVFSVSTKIFDSTYEMMKDVCPMHIFIISDSSVYYSDIRDACYADGYTEVNEKTVSTVEPTYDIVDELTEVARRYTPDLIVAIGGGSVMDMGKAVGVMLRNPLLPGIGSGSIQYRGMNKVQNPGVPVVCYPTTAGTGAEVTHTASLIDTKTNTKMGINGRYVAPYGAVFVPELLYSCPKSVTISSGLDAMVHAYESITSKMATDITRDIGSKALSLMLGYLPLAIEMPDCYEHRKKTLLGAYYAGISMMNAAGGLASAISYPLGVHYKIPHGLAGGLLLPYEVQLYDDRGSPEKAWFPPDFIWNFYEKIGAPKTFPQLKRSDVPALTDIVMRERGDVLKLCPVFVDRDDVERILYSVSSP
jgi:alcohol dehydrogenase class IV